MPRKERLARQNEERRGKKGEVKGKRKKYKRVYNLDKMLNETEEERTNRLQKRKQDRAAETIDERARILEILRETQQLQMKTTKSHMSG